jgi:hypothetical protein
MINKYEPEDSIFQILGEVNLGLGLMNDHLQNRQCRKIRVMDPE